MGKIIYLSPQVIRPTEIDVRNASLEKLLPYFLNNKLEELDPPALRKRENEFFVLDGHNKLVLADLFNLQTFRVYVAEKCIDEITKDQIPRVNPRRYIRTNESIEMRFDECLHSILKVEKTGIYTIPDLRAHYTFLENLPSLQAHLSSTN